MQAVRFFFFFFVGVSVLGAHKKIIWLRASTKRVARPLLTEEAQQDFRTMPGGKAFSPSSVPRTVQDHIPVHSIVRAIPTSLPMVRTCSACKAVFASILCPSLTKDYGESPLT